MTTPYSRATSDKAQAEYVCWRDGKVKRGGDGSNRQIAKMLGVHHDTVDRDIGGKPPRGGKKGSSSNEAGGGNTPALTGADAAKTVAKTEAKEMRKAANIATGASP
jgi:IS30 family transposase